MKNIFYKFIDWLIDKFDCRIIETKRVNNSSYFGSCPITEDDIKRLEENIEINKCINKNKFYKILNKISCNNIHSKRNGAINEMLNCADYAFEKEGCIHTNLFDYK